MNHLANAPSRVAGWQPTGPSELSAIGVVEAAKRANLIKLTTGMAMAGGGVYALMNVPGTKSVQKLGLATLGGALLVTAVLNVYDALA